MKIYIAHSSSFDYKNELYVPLRDSVLNTQHEFVLPHESDTFTNSKDKIKNSDIVIAEVSHPSTGEGIELGWANSYNIPIACFYKETTKPSSSLKIVTDRIIAYTDGQDLIKKIGQLVNH